ncbi:hypothetical protein JCM6882_002763 [Rhodosporidiobolus microsporus]
MRSFLPLLINLTSLNITHVPRLTKIILSPPTTYAVLPALNRLRIEEQFLDVPHPWDPGHYRKLGQYPRLNILELHIVRSAASLRGYERAPIVPISPFLFWLSLKGPLQHPSAADLVASFHLESLCLYDMDPYATAISKEPVFTPLLEAAATPFLRTLSLKRRFGYETLPPLLLSRLGGLQTLELRAGTGLRDILPALVHLPSLSNVHLVSGVLVTQDEVGGLVSSPHKPPGLDSLHLDLLSKPSCGRILDPHPFYDEYNSLLPPDFSFATITALDNLAKENGITLHGVAVELARAEAERVAAAAAAEAAEAAESAVSGADWAGGKLRGVKAEE